MSLARARARGRQGACRQWRAALVLAVPVLAGSMLTVPALAAAPPAGAACGAPWLALDAGVQDSRWQETGSQGRTLVSESGTLRGVSLSLGARCDGFDGLVRVRQASGSRLYEGVTSTNAPIRTRSEIEQHAVELQGFLPLDTLWSGWSGWSAAGRAALRRTDRRIIGVGRVQGYPERFIHAEVGFGARLAMAPGADWNWTATAWLGAGPPGRLDLHLPGTDPAKLRLGASRSLEFELQAQGALDALVAQGWQWQARLAHRREQWRAGEPQVITRQGVPVAGAVQPATRHSAWRLQFGLRFDF